MPKLKNCRNCKWADWYKSASGRKFFGNYAACVYPVIVVLPASRREANSLLKNGIGVAEYRNVPLDCKTWEAKRKET
jgi:hypothetical protein